jgi:1-deoxy-D-xylulose-5-phosphate reductoisomerase
LIILGSTGSIGVNALDVCERMEIGVELLCAGNNCELLKKQIEKFRPKYACIEKNDSSLGQNYMGAKIFYGANGLSEALKETISTKALNAIVGFAGLRSTLDCMELGKEVALANKESLVAAGKFIDTSKIIPVDSEHFALWYLNRGGNIRKMTITASGGALRDAPLKEIYASSVGDVLKHPNWTMGRKITVDSATMVNKLFEIIEAHWLFGGDISYDAIIETSSTIHAMIEFDDGVTTAQMSEPDMRLPISYALTGKAAPKLLNSIDLVRLGSLEFRAIEEVRYPVWRLKEALLANPSSALVLNAANEVAVAAFLDERIAFGEIANTIFAAYERYESVKTDSIDDVFALNNEVRNYANSVLKA